MLGKPEDGLLWCCKEDGREAMEMPLPAESAEGVAVPLPAGLPRISRLTLRADHPDAAGSGRSGVLLTRPVIRSPAVTHEASEAVADTEVRFHLIDDRYAKYPAVRGGYFAGPIISGCTGTTSRCRQLWMVLLRRPRFLTTRLRSRPGQEPPWPPSLPVSGHSSTPPMAARTSWIRVPRPWPRS